MACLVRRATRKRRTSESKASSQVVQKIVCEEGIKYKGSPGVHDGGLPPDQVTAEAGETDSKQGRDGRPDGVAVRRQ
jgi:hypothetical protein